ncbi:MobA/MobL family protein [Sphingomonas sp. 22176]|uniref:MobA/MobL family protein n=1 Tax=Sphingomonas sp. 22176 TaxID=3453884 RepID=UPI003F87B694
MVDGTWVAEGGREVKKALRQDRCVERKRMREQVQVRSRQLWAACEDARSARRLAKELADWENAFRRWGASVRVQDKPRKAQARSRKAAKKAPPSRRSPSCFKMKDALGRIGVYIRGDYSRAGGKGGAPGCAARHFDYTMRDGAALADVDGEPVLLSNIGHTIDEIRAGWGAIEAVARALRKNAKIQVRFVLALDADASDAEKIDAVRRFGDIFEALGLPYSAVIHRPDQDGDDRNWHVHFLTSFRPAKQIAYSEWKFADDLVTAIDGPEGMRTLRHLWAHAQTEAARHAGRDVEYTGLSYGARGLDLEAQQHLGPALSDLVARGETVAAHTRNVAIAARNVARMDIQDLSSKRDALARIKEAILEAQRRELLRLGSTGFKKIEAPRMVTPRKSPSIADTKPANGLPSQRQAETIASVSPPDPLSRVGAAAVKIGVAGQLSQKEDREETLSSEEPRAVPSRRAAASIKPIKHSDAKGARRKVRIDAIGAREPLAHLRPGPNLATLPAAGESVRSAAMIVASGPLGTSVGRVASASVKPLPTLAPRTDAPPLIGVAIKAAAPQSRAPSQRLPAMLFDTPPLRALPLREGVECFEVAATAVVSRGGAVVMPARSASTPPEPKPRWWSHLEQYLRWLTWRRQEDDSARKRLGGYAALPPAYREAVEAVEQDPSLVVEREARLSVRADVPPALAAQIEQVTNDPHWREFLRRVRLVALERQARASRPIPLGMTLGDTKAGTTNSRQPGDGAHGRAEGLMERASEQTRGMRH